MAMLGNIFGGGAQRQGMSPIDMALLGVLAYRTLKGKGRLAEILGRSHSQSPSGQTNTDAGFGNVLNAGLGALGGLFGGQSGATAISDGLRQLLERFEQNGQGDKIRSWMSTAPSKSISPDELGQALGEERTQWLMQQTGLSREELLAGISERLPDLVDKLTPQGRLPSPGETADTVLH